MNFQELRNLTDSFMAARILQVAVNLKIFDLTASESPTVRGISRTLKTDERATELFCNALAGMGLLEKRDGMFSNTEVSQKYLVTSSPYYWGWIIRHNYSAWKTWGELENVLKTGKSFVKKIDREYTEKDHENFIMGMHSIVSARGDADLMAGKLNLSGCKKLLDVGGGPGTFSIKFCEKYPNLSATVFDFPETENILMKNVGRFQEVSGRIDFAGGDFNSNDLPAGFDLVFISNIIHSLDEEQCARLMKKAYQSLNNGGQIVVKDHIMNEDFTMPVNGAIFSIHMLIHTRGRDYSFIEISRWLAEAGFSNINMLELPEDTQYQVMVASK